MTKSIKSPQIDRSSDAFAMSLVEKDLSVSWDTVGSEYDWYRVESICTPVECISMGVESDKCPSMTVVSTVVAQNLEELCVSLSEPKVNSPMSAKVLSVQKYSRSYLKQNNQPDQCNILEDVEFCQIPECQEFCVETSSSFVFDKIWSNHLIHDQEPKRGFWRRGGYPKPRHGRKDNLPKKTVLREPDGELKSLDGDSLFYEGYGSVIFSGASYLVSPSWSFLGSGSLQASGSMFLSFDYESQGYMSFLGYASDLKMSASFSTSGTILFSGSACCVSPSYNFLSSGSLVLSGSGQSPAIDMGVFTAACEVSATAFDMGYEYIDGFQSSPLSISDFTVSSCGCQEIAPILLLRHNLQKSTFFHRFVSSENIQFPEQIPMRYRKEDDSWRFYERMSGRDGTLSVSSSFSCLSDSWRIDFGLDDDLKRTRITLDIPFDIICSGVMRSFSMLFYFSSFSSESGYGERIPAVNPIKSKSITVYGKVDSFVDGVFVPETVYYDHMGIFSDSFWSYAPFELRMNPPSKKLTKTIYLSRII